MWQEVSKLLKGEQYFYGGSKFLSSPRELTLFLPSNDLSYLMLVFGTLLFLFLFLFLNRSILGEFPGSPVVKTWCFHCSGLVGELRSCKPCSVAKKKKKLKYS